MNNKIRDILENMPSEYRQLLNPTRTNERNTEYIWVWRNLIPEGRILDVGCCESRLAEVLSGLGYAVWGIDLRDYPNAPFHFVKGDIRRTSFQSSFFNQIIGVSTIEHVGMKAYGNTWIDQAHGDRMAILEMYRILELSGTMLITLPYGASEGNYWLRCYNKDSLKRLLWGLNWEATYYCKQGNTWRRCPEYEASQMPSGEGSLPNAIVCVKGAKP